MGPSTDGPTGTDGERGADRLPQGDAQQWPGRDQLLMGSDAAFSPEELQLQSVNEQLLLGWRQEQLELLYDILSLLQDILNNQLGASDTPRARQDQVDRLLLLLQQLIDSLLDAPAFPVVKSSEAQAALRLQLLALLQQLQQGALGRAQMAELLVLLQQLMSQSELSRQSSLAAMDVESLARLLLELLQELGAADLGSALSTASQDLVDQVLDVLQQLLLQLLNAAAALGGWQAQASQLATLLGPVAQQPPGAVALEVLGSRRAQADAMLLVLDSMKGLSTPEGFHPGQLSASEAQSQAAMVVQLLQLVRQQDLGMLPSQAIADSKQAQAAILSSLLQQLGQQIIGTAATTNSSTRGRTTVLSSVAQQLRAQGGTAAAAAKFKPAAAGSQVAVQMEQLLLQALADLPIPAPLARSSGTSVLAALRLQLQEQASPSLPVLLQAADTRAQGAILLAALQAQAPQWADMPAKSAKSAAVSQQGNTAGASIMLLLVQQLAQMDLAAVPRPALADRPTAIMLALQSQLLELAGRPQVPQPLDADQQAVGGLDQPRLAGLASSVKQWLVSGTGLDASVGGSMPAASGVATMVQQTLQQTVSALLVQGDVDDSQW